MTAIEKLRQPGGMTKVNQLKFLWELAKVGGLDNSAPDIVKLKKVWGEYLRERRGELSMRDVARRLHVNHRTIAMLEQGEAHIATYPFSMMVLEAYLIELKEKTGSEELQLSTPR